LDNSEASQERPSAARDYGPRRDVYLYLPKRTFRDLHASALKLDVSDSFLLQSCWMMSKPEIDQARGKPRLAKAKSARVFFSFNAAIDDDLAAASTARDRSKSWLAIKAWNQCRDKVHTFGDDTEAFKRWLPAVRERFWYTVQIK
jgi:hypothetical protein